MELEPCGMDLDIQMDSGMPEPDVPMDETMVCDGVEPNEEGESELSAPLPSPRRRRVRTPSESPTPQATRLKPIPPDDDELNAEAVAKAKALISSLPFARHF